MFAKMLGQLEQFLIQFTSLSIEKKDQQNSLKEYEIDELQRIITKIMKSPRFSADIFETSNRPMLGQLVSILLDAFSQPKMALETRMKCGAILCSITDEKFKENSADFIAFILPGIFSTCQNILLANLNELKSLEILNFASKILTNILAVSFTNLNPKLDENINKNEPPNAFLAFKRDENWGKMAKERILKQLSAILSRMSGHNIDAIRAESLKIVYRIFELNIFDEFARIALDLVSVLYNEDIPSIQNFCSELVPKLQSNKELIESYALQKLTKSLKTLEKDVKNASMGQKYLDNLINLCTIINSTLVNRLFLSQNFLERFFSAILCIIEVDCSKELVSDYHPEEREDHQHQIISFPLKYGINEKQIYRLARFLINLPNFENLFDYLLDHFNENSMSLERRIAILFVIFQMMRAFSLEKDGQIKNANCHQFIGNFLDLLKTMDPMVEEDVSDKQIEEIIPSNSKETSIIQLLIGCLSHIKFDQIPSKLVGDVLYELLKWSSSTNFAIKAAANHCLALYAKQEYAPSSESALSDFILAHVHQIMFKVLLAAHDFALNPRFPLVIAEMVSRCAKNPKMFTEIRGGIGECLYWLDRSAQNRTMLLLRALRNYTLSMLEWFPNLMPSTSSTATTDNTDPYKIEKGKNVPNDDPNCELISNSTAILNRTKHFISSRNLPIQLLILDILNYSLEFIKNYENDLLPMIHQNWHGLIRKLGDDGKIPRPMTESEKLVAVKAIQVIERICIISTDFVHRKVVDDFIPRAHSLLKMFSKVSSSAMRGFERHTATYRLQFALINSTPTILLKSNVFAAEYIEPFKQLLASYSNCAEFCDELRKKALESLIKIEQFPK